MSDPIEVESDTVRLVWNVSLKLTAIWGFGIVGLIIAGWIISRADMESLRRQLDDLEVRIGQIKAPMHQEQRVQIEQAEGVLERETRRILAEKRDGEL